MTRLAGAYISILVLTLGTCAVAHSQSCGETVTGTVTLTADLACPTGHGLFVGDGATLNCSGHAITGGDEQGQYGIYVRDVSGATVQNCTAEHFEVGIRLRGATNCTVQDSVAQHNTRYGIEIIQSSTGALILGNTIYNNSDEGMHVSGPTDADALHQILGNTVDNNALEGIYLLDSDANTVAGNIIHNQGTAGIYVKGSDRNTIDGNTLTNDPIQLMSGSKFNVLSNNTIIGQRLKFDGVSNNEVYNISIREQGGRPSNAYDFNNSSDNTIVDSEAIDPVDYHIRAANRSKNIVFTRFLAAPTLQCFVDKRSRMTVTDPNGDPLECGDSGGGGDGGGGGSSREKKCNDGKDNDGDGATDCDDPDCSGKAGCP